MPVKQTRYVSVTFVSESIVERDIKYLLTFPFMTFSSLFFSMVTRFLNEACTYTCDSARGVIFLCKAYRRAI
jgi:hypothetical protein